MALPAPSPTSTALVTGASAGIGVEIARDLARRGQGVTLVARRIGPMEVLAKELAAAHGVRVEVVACDLSDAAARDALVEDIAGRGLTVEILVNNAGFSNSGPFATLDRESELRMIRTNIEAVVDLTARYLPGMIERKRGAILNVASTASYQPIPGQATYAASKSFVLSFTEAVHAEAGGAGVTLTALCPGPVKTEFADVAGMTNVESSLPDFAWVPPAEVARAGMAALAAGKRVVIPGPLNVATSVMGRLTPRGILLPLMKRFYPA